MVGSGLIFAILDDGTLSVYASLDEVQRDLEAIDIFADVYSFFDERGQRLQPLGDLPETGRLLGLTWIGGGQLQRFEPVDGAPLLGLLSDLKVINANPHFVSIDAVDAYLRPRA